MRKQLIFFVIVFICANNVYAQTKIQLEDYFRDLKSVTVEIGGKSYNFLFDTGGGITIVSPNIIKEINKSTYGNSVGFRMSGEIVESKLCDSLNIKIGGIDFFHSYVGVFDVMSLLPKEFEQIDGLISLKTFEQNYISLNLRENQLIIETEESYEQKTKELSLLNSRFVNGPNGSELNIFIGIKYKQQLWWFLFDSGNIAQAKISQSIAQEWDLSYQENEITEIGNYKFEIAGDSISTSTIIDNIIYDGALSFDFIQQAEFTISFPDRKMWKTVQNKHKK